MSSRLYNICLALMCLALFIYVVLKACTMSLTCDESSTLHVTEALNAFDIWYKADWFTSANNHILNSALLRISISVFGWHEWAIRLPNILAYALYLWACYKICNHICHHKIIGLFGILILNASCFFVDFFSIARGYGIAASLAMAALAIFITSNKSKKIWVVFALLSLAILANFTYINYFEAFALYINFYNIVLYKNVKSIKSFLQLNIAPLFFIVLTACIIYKPITYLMHNNEFLWGANTLWISIQDYVANFLYETNNTIIGGQDKLHIILVCILGAPLLGLIAACFFYKKQNFITTNQTIIAATFLLCCMVLITVLQRHLLNTMYLDERKTIMYTPLILLIWVCIGNYIFSHKVFVLKACYSILISGLLANFIHNTNINSCRQWWYNANTKKAVQYVVKHKPNSKILVEWPFYYSVLMYNNYFYKNTFNTIITNRETLPSDTSFDFCFFTGTSLPVVHPIYLPVLRVTYDGFLFKKNSLNYLLKTDSLKVNLNVNALVADSILLKKRATEDWNLWLPIAK